MPTFVTLTTAGLEGLSKIADNLASLSNGECIMISKRGDDKYVLHAPSFLPYSPSNQVTNTKKTSVFNENKDDAKMKSNIKGDKENSSSSGSDDDDNTSEDESIDSNSSSDSEATILDFHPCPVQKKPSPKKSNRNIPTRHKKKSSPKQQLKKYNAKNRKNSVISQASGALTRHSARLGGKSKRRKSKSKEKENTMPAINFHDEWEDNEFSQQHKLYNW